MSTAPATLTAERIDSLLSMIAETCADGVEDARAQMKGAEDAHAFERATRSFNGLCRTIRHAIAVKMRVDRERLGLAVAEARAHDEAEARVEKARAEAVRRHAGRVSALYRLTRWNEVELTDDEDEFDDCDVETMLYQGFLGRLSVLQKSDDFLDTPVETLLEQIACDHLGRTRRSDDPAPKPEPEPGPPEAPEPAAAAPPHAQTSQETAQETAEDPAGETASPDDVTATPAPPRQAEPAPDLEPCAATPPPERPPDPKPPDPEPYLPPWEKLRPGQSWPGGSGW